MPVSLSWTCGAQADERWVLVDVTLWTLASERALRRRRLRLRRSTEDPSGSLTEALRRLERLDEPASDPLEAGGFRLVAVLDEETVPIGTAALLGLRADAPGLAGSVVGEGGRWGPFGRAGPSLALPKGEAAGLTGRVQDLLPLSLQARLFERALPGASPRVLRQHAFLRHLAPFARRPVGGRALDLVQGEDRHFRLAWVEVEVQEGEERQVERWCLGCPYGASDEGWIWLDLRHPALFPLG